MGWILFLEWYFSIIYFGILVGVFYPIYTIYFRKEFGTGARSVEVKSPIFVAYLCLVNAVRFGFFTFVGLIVLGFIAAILLSIWAIAWELLGA